MSNYLEKLIKATHIEEEDKSKVKWPRVKRYRLPRQQTTFISKHRYRPEPKVYWNILREANRCVEKCEMCSSTFQITVHHKNGNCFDNKLENLQVLCWTCHRNLEQSTEEGVLEELEGTVADF